MTSLRWELSALVASLFWIPIAMAQPAQLPNTQSTGNDLVQATRAWRNGDFIRAHELARQECSDQPSDES